MNEPKPQGELLNSLALLLATWFGSGLLPKAPGTWGTAAAIPFILILHYFLSPATFFIAALAVILISIPIAQRALLLYQHSDTLARRNPHEKRAFTSDLLQGMIKDRDSQRKDPGMIVIDEVAGMTVAMILVPFSLVGYIAAFFAFRFFDIVKLFPATALERLEGGTGIVLDDVAAGIYACLATHLFLYVYTFLGFVLI